MSVEQRSKHTHTLWLDGQWNDGLSESRVQLNDHSQRVFWIRADKQSCVIIYFIIISMLYLCVQDAREQLPGLTFRRRFSFTMRTNFFDKPDANHTVRISICWIEAPWIIFTKLLQITGHFAEFNYKAKWILSWIILITQPNWKARLLKMLNYFIFVKKIRFLFNNVYS